MNGKVLIVDDDASTCELLRRHLEERGFVAHSSIRPEEAFRTLTQEDFDLVLTDLNMANLNGIELCDRIVTNYPHIPVVVITAFGSLETAVEAIRVGAYDFITKPVDLNALAHSIERAIKHSKLIESVKRLNNHTEHKEWKDHEFLGDSSAIVELRSVISRLSESDLPVTIYGEDGSGKELAARLLHRQSSRRSRPFIVLNCATLSEKNAQMEILGYSEGAAQHSGALIQATGGTLLLREINQLPMQAQMDLERALANGYIMADSSTKIPIDIRLIVTMANDYQEDAISKQIRKDLFQRISVISIPVPSLRNRENDVLILAQHFVQVFARRQKKSVLGIGSGVAAKLLQYSWPGNVRELRNTIERAVALTSHERLVVEDLPDSIRRYRRSELNLEASTDNNFLQMEEVERKHILSVLQSLDGNKVLTAKVLGLDRRTLYRKLERYGL